MNLFIKYLSGKIVELPQIVISKTLEKEVQNYCIEKLGLKDIGDLRDKFEGQAYLDKRLNKVSAYFAASEYLLLPKLEINKIIEMNNLSIKWNNRNINIEVFKFGELPELTKANDSVLFVLQKDKYKFSICGIATIDILNDVSNYIENKGKSYFIGFDKLEKI